jgi:hypothetical protein
VIGGVGQQREKKGAVTEHGRHIDGVAAIALGKAVIYLAIGSFIGIP